MNFLATEYAKNAEKCDVQSKFVFDAIRQLMTPPEPKQSRIGFLQAEKEK